MQTALNRAFDRVVKHLQEHSFIPFDSRGDLVVWVTTFNCGHVAQSMLTELRNEGLEGFRLHSLRGHYVVRHDSSGRLYDLETYQGVHSKEELPYTQRFKVFAAVGLIADESRVSERLAKGIYRLYAIMWERRRAQNESGAKPFR